MVRAGSLAAVLALTAMLAALPAPASGKAPALFRVGAARVSTDPDPKVPLYSGGFGVSPPITRVNDPLSVRAIYVSNGRRAVAIAVVDAQGYFASYQEGDRYGITDERRSAARRITQLGAPRVSAGDIVVQATHGHAAPTLEGIWGPVPVSYLKKVHDAVVSTLVTAAREARPAYLETGTVDASRLDTATMDTDSYPGWSNDGELHVLRGVDPRTRATIATFASVSVHGAHVRGDHDKRFSADYFGMSEAALERALGGIAIVGPGTLGREESPVEVTDVPTARWFSGTVTSLIAQALATARFISDSAISASERMVQVPATNAALLALNRAFRLPEEQRQQILAASGIYPIDRADAPPYLTGNVLGTYVTALRIGPLAYVSMPGEPFPEVAHALRLHVSGAQTITLLSKGQDDLGYFYPTWVYPFVFAYGDDHHLFSVAPQAGDQFVLSQLRNVAQIGFRTTPYAAPAPLQTELTRTLSPGLEALASPVAGDAGPDGRFRPVLSAIYSPPTFSSDPASGPVRWDFGDGTRGTSGYLITGQNYGHNFDPHLVGKPGRFTHAYRPGRYTARLSATDADGRTVTWSLPIVAYSRLCPSVAVRSGRRRALSFAGRARGGQSKILAWRWRFGDGARAQGRRVRHRFRRGARRRAKLTVTDGTGTTASVRVAAAPGARRRACRTSGAPL